MGLLGDWVGSKRMEKPVRGTAQVVGSTQPPDSATSSNANLNLVVSAEGLEPTAVEHSAICPTKKWPWPGTTLPVTVDLMNPDRLKIEWDEVEDASKSAKRQAEQVAEAMKDGGGTAGAGAPGGGDNIVIQGGQMDDATRQRLAGMGVDVDALMQQAQQMQQMYGGAAGAGQAAAAQGGAAPSGGGGGGDDIVDQLEHLNQLKSQGALSDEEFEKAKKKLLEG